MVTGLIAILLGSLALGGIHHTRQRGTGLAVTGILLGLADTVGWIVFSPSIYGRAAIWPSAWTSSSRMPTP